MDRSGIIFQTGSGTHYVYNTATNQIISINNDWYKNISNMRHDEIVFETLADNGVPVGDFPDVIDWPLNSEEYRKVVEEAIPSLVLEITQECTLRCGYCVYSGNYKDMRVHGNKRMSRKMIKRCIDYYATHSKMLNTANISFYGGEALMCFDKVRFAVEYAREILGDKTLKFRISSNGTTLTETVAEWLEKNRDVSVTVTVNGMSHDKYRKFPSGHGSLKTISTYLSKIRNNYPGLWNRIDFIANVASLQELLELRPYYIKYIGKPPLLITGILEYGGNEVIRRIVDTKDPEHIIDQVKNLLFMETDRYILPYYRTDIVNIASRDIGLRDRKCIETASCMPFTSSLFVSAKGEFGMCERTGVCGRLGNLYQGIDIGFAEKLLENVFKVLNDRCRTCWCQRLCTVCLKDYQISQDGGVILPNKICSATQENVKMSLMMFCNFAEKNPSALTWIQNHEDSPSDISTG